MPVKNGHKLPTQRGKLPTPTTKNTKTTAPTNIQASSLGKHKVSTYRERIFFIMKVLLVLLLTWLVTGLIEKKFFVKETDILGLDDVPPAIKSLISSFSNIRKLKNKTDREHLELESILPRKDPSDPTNRGKK
jgi:hypothetical protein